HHVTFAYGRSCMTGVETTRFRETGRDPWVSSRGTGAGLSHLAGRFPRRPGGQGKRKKGSRGEIRAPGLPLGALRHLLEQDVQGAGAAVAGTGRAEGQDEVGEASGGE